MKTKRFLSILLSLVLVFGSFPNMSLTAFADNTTTITPGTDDAKTGTGTMTITLTITDADVVKNQINALPAAEDVTATNKDDIEAARAAYDALTDEEKTQVGNEVKAKLEAAEAALVNALLNALPAEADVTADSKDTIESARAAYDALTDAQKERISADTLKKLTNAETALKAIEDQAAADAVSTAINNLPASADVTTAKKDAIEAARTAYDALTADQKAKVSADTLKKLTDAEVALKELTDAATAQEVTNTISALPDFANVTADNKAAIEAARTAYDALTTDQKAKVSAETLKKLTDAEDKLVVLQAMSEVSAKTGSGMTYTGNPIQLIDTPTTALPNGYTIKYAVTTENKAPADKLYSTSIPSAVNPGTYYVWYYVTGKDGKNDTAAASTTVTIADESVKAKAEKAKKNNKATISDNVTMVPDAKGKVWTLDASVNDASSNEISVKVTFASGAKVKLNGYDKTASKQFKTFNKAAKKTGAISTKGILRAKKEGTGVLKYATADGKTVTIEYTVVKPAIAAADGKDTSVNSVAPGSVKKLKATYTAAGNFDVKLTGVPLNSLYTFKGKKVLNENNIVIGEDGCLHITGELEARKTAKVIINAQGKKYTVLITGKFR